MPDGDRVHPGLARQYQKVYKQLCEGQQDNASLAHEAVAAVKQRLKQIGDAPLQFIAQAAAGIAEIPSEPLLRAIVDWSEQSQAIDKLARQTPAQKRSVELATEACKELLFDVRNGDAPKELAERTVERFFHKLYNAEFEESMPLSEHYNGADQQYVDDRLHEIRPFVQHELTTLARQAINSGSVEHLRQPSIPKPTIDLHETDILSLS